MIGQTLKPSYYTPSSNIHGEDTEGITRHLPSTVASADEWVLIDGTPASCVQIGLYHFFQDKGPIDLVISGPNYGRNTTSVFALSSGTLGAALEASVCRKKAVALSFAFFTRNHDPLIIEGACRHSIKVIEALYKQWPTDGSTDLYSVNIPLVEGVEGNKTLWADMLQNYWREGSCFQEVEDNAGDADEEEARIREGEVDNGSSAQEKKGHKHKHFKWAPRMADVYKSVDESGPTSDGRIIRDGNTW
jgi:5'/3'-nucleotidase SurE